jgi:hypothetical protein
MSKFVKCTDTLTINREFVESVHWHDEREFGHRTLRIRMVSGQVYSWLDSASCGNHVGPVCKEGVEAAAIASAILGDDLSSR